MHPEGYEGHGSKWKLLPQKLRFLVAHTRTNYGRSFKWSRHYLLALAFFAAMKLAQDGIRLKRIADLR